jgi:hypothetical protein
MLFLNVRNKFIFCAEGFLAACPTPKLEDNPLLFTTTAYSIYSQLPSIAGGRSSIRNPRTRHAAMTGNPRNMTHFTSEM